MIEINKSNSWTIHENVIYSVDFLLSNSSGSKQIRQFTSAEKTRIQIQKLPIYSNFYVKNQLQLSDKLITVKNSWVDINAFARNGKKKPISKSLVIYAYAIPNNFIREALIKSNIKFTVTNDLRKASVIVGLRKHLQQNFKIKELSKKKHIPIYSLNQLTIYQLMKFFKRIF